MKRNRTKTTIALLCALALSGLSLAVASSAVGTVAVYVNDMANTAKRAQVVKIFGRNCTRGGSPAALRVAVGAGTGECDYRTSVIGRDLEIQTTARLLSGTPKKLQHRAYLALELRAGGGGKITFAVFPGQAKYQIFKNAPGEKTKFLAVGKQISRIGGVNEANILRLQVFNILKTKDPDDARILAFVNNKRMAVVTDDAIGPLKGRFSGFSVGAPNTATGAVASFDDVSVRIPSPF